MTIKHVLAQSVRAIQMDYEPFKVENTGGPAVHWRCLR